jgi:deazaflavin-dependent oxidoreductase (nitroreductase family)
MARTRMHGLRPLVNRFLNPITRRVAGRLPGFALVTHVGRRSGRTYTVPLNVFRRGETWVVVLTYGSDVDWVRNVLAAGGCRMRTRGRDIRLLEPELVVSPGLHGLPLPVRIIEGAAGATELLILQEARPTPA